MVPQRFNYMDVTSDGGYKILPSESLLLLLFDRQKENDYCNLLTGKMTVCKKASAYV